MNIDFYGFGMEAEDQNKDSQVEKDTDGDTDAEALEALNSINSLEYLDFYSKLQERNSDEKIKMLRKINASVSVCKDKSKFASLESYIAEQAMETAAQSEVNGGKHKAEGANLDKQKLGEKKASFFKKMWETIKEAFKKIVTWIKDKISQFVNWIRGLFQKNDLNKIQELEKPEYDALEAALTKFEFENQSEDGAIPLFGGAADKLLGKTNTFYTLCKHLEAMIGQMTSTGFKPEGFTTQINTIIDALKEIPGVGNVPKISSASKENIDTFNREFKTAISHLKYSYDPVGYTKYYTGQTLIEKKDKLTCKQYFNTFDPKAIVAICNNTVDCLKKIDDMISKCEACVKNFDKSFMIFLEKNHYTDKSGNVTVADKIDDDKKETADLNYQFVGSCLSLFKCVQAITSVISSIGAKLMDSAKLGAKAMLSSKARAINAKEGDHMITGAHRTAHDKGDYNKIHDSLDKSLTNGATRYDDAETKTMGDKVGGALNKAKKAAKKLW